MVKLKNNQNVLWILFSCVIRSHWNVTDKANAVAKISSYAVTGIGVHVRAPSRPQRWSISPTSERSPVCSHTLRIRISRSKWKL